MIIKNLKKRNEVCCLTQKALLKVVCDYIKTTDLVSMALTENDTVCINIYTPSPSGAYTGFLLIVGDPMTQSHPNVSSHFLECLSTECGYFVLISNDLLEIITLITKYTMGVLD